MATDSGGVPRLGIKEHPPHYINCPHCGGTIQLNIRTLDVIDSILIYKLPEAEKK